MCPLLTSVVPLNSPLISSGERRSGEGERRNWSKSISKPESLSTSSEGLLGSRSSLAGIVPRPHAPGALAGETEEKRELMNGENRLLPVAQEVWSSSIDRSSSGFRSHSRRISLGSHSDSVLRRSTTVLYSAKGTREASESSLRRMSIQLTAERSGREIVGLVQRIFLGERLESERSVRIDGGTNSRGSHAIVSSMLGAFLLHFP